MTVENILAALQQVGTGADRNLSFRAEDAFAARLTLGQIIKGKVLRHYESGRYLVSFGGEEKVVDSSVRLQVGDMLRGRVIRVDDKVHLQRLAGEEQSSELQKDPTSLGLPREFMANSRENLVQWLARYQVELSQTDTRLLNNLSHKLGRSANLAGSILALTKAGVPLNAEWISAIHHTLQQAQQGSTESPTAGIKLSGVSPEQAPSAEQIALVSTLLARFANVDLADQAITDEAEESQLNWQVLADGAQENFTQFGDGRQDDLRYLGEWLLNVQTLASVSHRYFHFPLWLGDNLVEISLALFDQQSEGETGSRDSLPYRKAVFELNTSQLGHIEIELRVADRHLRLRVHCETEATAEYLATHMRGLEQTLNERDWHLDEVHYVCQPDKGGAARAVVEHYALQDSLSRLM